MPVSRGEFFAVFAAWNMATWPYWILAFLAGLANVALCFRRSRRAARAVLILLAGLWLVCGVAYHWTYFAQVNPAAWLFGAGFVHEALLMIAMAFSPDLRIALHRDLRSIVALLIVAYRLLLYPMVGWLSGHTYPAMPIFGIASCPTVIFTLGVLLLASGQGARWLLVLPLIWGVIGGSAAVLLAVPQDNGLIVAALVTAALSLARVRGKNPADTA